MGNILLRCQVIASENNTKFRQAFGHTPKQQTDHDCNCSLNNMLIPPLYFAAVRTDSTVIQKSVFKNLQTKLKSFLPQSNFANTAVSGLSDCCIRLGVLYFGIAQVQNSA